MELIVFAALCSVAVSIILKIAKNKGYVPIQMIAWNYAAASILCFFWFRPDVAEISLSQTPWGLILALGILLPSVFLILSQSLQRAGILKTEIAQRLSVVLSLSAAYFVFQEQFNQLKILGIMLGMVAVLLILVANKKGEKQNQGQCYLILVWLGYATIDILLKYTTNLGLQFALVLNLMFVCAFMVSMIYLCIQYRNLGSMRNILAGLTLGVINFANIAFYVQAHRLLKDSPAIVFAGMNMLVVIFGVLAGMFLFKEKFKTASAIGLIFGLTSVICLAYAMY